MDNTLIEQLELEAHPEGGFYRRTFESKLFMADSEGREVRIASAIYYYLASDDFSAWHRLDTDEMFHFYSGTSLTLHMINSEGKLSHISLGDPCSDAAYIAQFVVPRDNWFALEVDAENSYSLVGCTNFPEFQLDKFEIAKRRELAEQFPDHKCIIERLTRE